MLNFNPFNKLPFVMLSLLLMILTYGCVSKKFDLSVPKEVPAGFNGKIDLTVIRVDYKSIILSAEIQEIEPLAVWLSIDAGDDQMELIPDQVRITLKDVSIKSNTFMGPAEPWESPRAIYQGCGPRKYNFGWAYTKVDLSVQEVTQGSSGKGIFQTTADPVPFEGQKCFLFFYNMIPSKESNYTVHIEGLKLSGEPVHLPALQFIEGKISKIFPTP
jgi:hypothetical protein